MLITKKTIIKTKTALGDFAKIYVFGLKDCETDEPVIIIYKFLLLKHEIDEESKQVFDLVKTYKDKYLYMQRISFKKSTFEQITDIVECL